MIFNHLGAEGSGKLLDASGYFTYTGVEGSGKTLLQTLRLLDDSVNFLKKYHRLQSAIGRYYREKYGKPVEIYPFPKLKEKKIR